MNFLGDVWRHSFPKGLQYCKQCLILHSTLSSIAKRYKHKRYIPRSELQDAVDSFVPMPCGPILCIPVIRHVLFIRLINAVRTSVFGRPAWLFTLNVAREHKKVRQWLESDLKRISNRKLERFVDRETFQREVLGTFHVAAMYHRVFRGGVVMCLMLVACVLFELLFAEWLNLYLRYWCGLNDDDIRAYFREVTERHTVSEVPPAYASRLPPPCALIQEGSIRRYCVEVCEFISPDDMKRVVLIPTPCVGERSFFEAVGAIARKSDALLLEGVPDTHINRVAPMVLLPMREPTFSAFRLHHRFYDILHDNKQEPPKLCASAAPTGLLKFTAQSLVPTTLRHILLPSLVSGSKAEAKHAWAHLKELLEDEEMLHKSPQNSGSDGHYTICVPWTVGQVVNLEASLLKLGYRLQRHYAIPWLHEDFMAEQFLSRGAVK
jgi:hypothetical protein